jgi:hypothetical protein
VDDSKVIVRALKDQVHITGGNRETVLRLIVIALAYLRHFIQRQILEKRRARRAGHSHDRHHHDGHHCDDPNCTEHGGTHATEHRAEPDTPIPGVPDATD